MDTIKGGAFALERLMLQNASFHDKIINSSAAKINPASSLALANAKAQPLRWNAYFKSGLLRIDAHSPWRFPLAPWSGPTGKTVLIYRISRESKAGSTNEPAATVIHPILDNRLA
jgi:hypothetical protein